MARKKTSMLSQKLSKDVFFGTSPDMPHIIEVEIAKLRPNPDQPRTNFDEEALQDLAGSISEHGLIQPIAVIEDRENEGGFVIVAGERRYRAYKLLGKDTIPAIMTSGNPDEIALIENMQREDLSPIEEAEALAKLMNRHKYKQEELAKVIGKARTTITELLSLNALPDEIKTECRMFDMAPKSVLVQIARLGKKEQQLQFWGDFKRGEMKSVRAVKERKATGQVVSSKPKPKKLFHTQQKATVIVQSQTSRLTQEQITSALREALSQAEKPED